MPSAQFQPRFIDDSADAYLHLLNQNHDRAPHVEGLALAYAHTEVLRVPDRTVRAEVLRPLLKACREGLRLEIGYVSLANPQPEGRLIASHTLVYTGMRWHVCAYCEKNCAYRDFVLSRLRGVPELLEASAHGRAQDETLRIEPDPRLSAEQRAIIETERRASGGGQPRCPGAVRAAALPDRHHQDRAEGRRPADRGGQPGGTGALALQMSDPSRLVSRPVSHCPRIW
ncbi:WYL domain-containing protein [Azotobacter beijerinckii]|uniref:WYL domain-containing protein n=1 Tax=Azotobacter beijerinckii TaxID=170623 RepID=A0A1I4EGR5_9GAMM|nr:WYL domain-containing protein [Azotobacter beijerinckii]SFL04955.1 WYL domain-containing protein [Azotobacter beijerinckii]